MGTIWDQLGHYETFSRDTTTICGKFPSFEMSQIPTPLKPGKLFTKIKIKMVSDWCCCLSNQDQGSLSLHTLVS